MRLPDSRTGVETGGAGAYFQPPRGPDEVVDRFEILQIEGSFLAATGQQDGGSPTWERAAGFERGARRAVDSED